MPFDILNSFNKSKCPSCGTPLQWGITTRKEKGKEICNVCKAVLGKD